VGIAAFAALLVAGAVGFAPGAARAAAMPRVSIADAVVGEGVGWTDLAVTLSAPSSSVVSVRYGHSGGTAGAFDYLAVSGELTFAPGERTKTIRVEIKDDADDEGFESFFMNLVAPVHATIGRSPATVRIRDND
jgi:hypothetical protein